MNWHPSRSGLRRGQRAPGAARGERPRRFRALPMNRLLPNMITVAALCAGMTGLRFAIKEQWTTAVFCIVLAMIFDGLDGKLARLLKGASQLGAELDSLCDFISFGVAPAFILYYWATIELGGFGWAIALAYAICCCYRLARFNTGLVADEKPAYSRNYFTGVPAPGGAGLVLMPMVLAFATADSSSGSVILPPAAIGAWMLFVGFLMASRVPTFALKNYRIPHDYVVIALLVVGGVVAAIISAPWSTLLVVGVLYLLSMPVSMYVYGKRKRLEAAVAAGGGPEAAGPASPPGDRALVPERSDRTGPG